jgi:BirA family biotin operon repressor/biotin-[acetyl-CoA-carboxylase] ligase
MTDTRKDAGERILELLYANSDREVSGEEIARAIGISRTAVWKHIEAMRAKGLDIRSSTKKGHRLFPGADPLHPFLITSDLGTREMGKALVVLESTGSSNDEARALANEGAAQGTTVVAEEQRTGKGRLGRQWVSPKGGIWMSVVLRPRLAPSRVSAITLVTGLAVARAVEKATDGKLSPLIKWPNDLLIDGKKVCGILTELDAEMDRLNFIIVGIGLNANFKQSLLPAEVRKKATTLAEAMGRPVPRVPLIRAMLEEMEGTIDAFVASGGDLGPMREEMRKRSALLGHRVRISEPGGAEPVEGKAVDIRGDGALVVDVAGIGKVPVISGSVEIL